MTSFYDGRATIICFESEDPRRVRKTEIEVVKQVTQLKHDVEGDSLRWSSAEKREEEYQQETLCTHQDTNRFRYITIGE